MQNSATTITRKKREKGMKYGELLLENAIIICIIFYT